MRRKLILCIAALGCLSLWAEQKQALKLNLVEGDAIVYYLDEVPTVTFVGQEMTVTTGKGSDVISMAKVEDWTIGMVEYTDVHDLLSPSSTVRVSVMGGSIYVACPNVETVQVYALDGRLIASQTAEAMQFDLPKGIYVIKTSTKTFKITNR